MSTILDALNRAERERRMGELPAIERLLEPPGLASLPADRQFPGRATIVTVVLMVSLGLVAAIVALMRTPPQAAYSGPLASFAGTPAPESMPARAGNSSEGMGAAAPESNPGQADSVANNSQPHAASIQKPPGGQARTQVTTVAPDPVANARAQGSATQDKAAQDKAAQDKAAQDKAATERSRQETPVAHQPSSRRQKVEASAQASRLPEREQSALAPPRASVVPAVVPTAPARTAQQAGAAAALATDKPAPAKGVEKPLPGMHELPASLRQQLPEIKLGGYIYSPSPAARSILINGKLLREGDQLVTGLRLEQMRPDGVVFEYKDVRFRMAY
jgi:hypothetical protein